MTDTQFENWLDEQMMRLRVAVMPTFKSLYAERESNRAALKEKDAALVQQANAIGALNAEVLQFRTSLAVKDTEIAALKRRIAELENPPPPPPPPPPVTTYDGGRVQVVWPAFNTTLVNWKSKIGDGKHIYAAVLHADLANKGGEWRDILALLGDKGIKRYAYIRLPHVRHAAGTTSAFEHQHRLLVERKDAFVYNIQGQRMVHPAGGDTYTVPWLIASELADLILSMVWNSGLYDGLYVDGLCGMNQVYVNDPGAADYDRDGKADVVQYSYATVAQKQFAASFQFVGKLRDVAPIIGNDSWMPDVLDITGIPSATKRLTYKTTPVTYTPATWIRWIGGMMTEDQTHPYMHQARTDQQAPSLPAESLDMHWRAVNDWVQAGKIAFMGGNFRLFGFDANNKPIGLPAEQGTRFLIASSLCLGGYVVRDASHPWLALNLGKPLGMATFSDANNWGRGVMTRQFTGGVVTCNAVTMTGGIA